MRRLSCIPIIVLMAILGCNNPKKASESNFTTAINKQLAVNGKACVGGFNQFPIDIAKSQLAWQKADLERLNALETVGLVKSTDMMAVPQGFNESQPVKRYDLSDSGKKYLQQQPGLFGSSSAFCYAQEAVDSIVKWNEPNAVGGFSMTVVTYTYRLNGVAEWARNEQFASLYPDIKREFAGEKTKQKAIGLQLTNKGWDTN